MSAVPWGIRLHLQPRQQKWGQTCLYDCSLIYKRMSLWDWWSWWSLSAAGGTLWNNDHPQRFPDKSMLTRQRESHLIVCPGYKESKIWLPARRCSSASCAPAHLSKRGTPLLHSSLRLRARMEAQAKYRGGNGEMERKTWDRKRKR